MLFFPFDAHFLSHDKFYKSIGFDEVFDRRAQGITTIHERDRVYFENALFAIDRHLRASGARFSSGRRDHDSAWTLLVQVPAG